MTLQTI